MDEYSVKMPVSKARTMCYDCNQPINSSNSANGYCRACSRMRARVYYLENRDVKVREKQLYNKKLKNEIIAHYSQGGTICANPYGQHEKPYSDIRALTIDHLNGGGTQHKREVNNNLYGWLKRNEFPEGFQVLCMNCQKIKQVVRNEFGPGRPRKYIIPNDIVAEFKANAERKIAIVKWKAQHAQMDSQPRLQF